MAQGNQGSIRSFLAWVISATLIGGGIAFIIFNLNLIPYVGPAALLGAVGSALLSIPFFARWLACRKEWWALITAWVFLAIALLLVVVLLNPVYPQVVAITALLEIAIPFLVIYYANKKHWWAIIPGYVPLALGILLALTMLGLRREIYGAASLLLIALPFWVIYMRDRMQWWAMLVAGISSLLGVLLLIAFSLAAMFQSGSAAFYVTTNILLAVVFLAIWITMRRFGWALWAAIGFAASAVLAVFLPSSASWAALALVLGVYIAATQLKQGGQLQAAQQALTGQQTQQSSSAGQTVPPPGPVPPPAPTPPAAPQAPAAPPAQTLKPVIPANEEAAPRKEPPPTDQGPVVSFRPLDPLGARKQQAASDEEETDDN